MPAMLSKLYHALLGAGVDDATATAAAEEAAQTDARFAELRLHLEQRFGQVDARLAVFEGHLGRTLDAVKALSERMESHFRLVSWTLGVLVAAFLGMLWRVLTLGGPHV